MTARKQSTLRDAIEEAILLALTFFFAGLLAVCLLGLI
jgi:hypothetical protein